MAISTINEAKPIVLKLDANSTSNVYPIFTDNDFTIDTGSVVSENIFVKNLKAYVKIASLPEANLPDITLEDSNTQALYKSLNTEWSSARKQLDLLVSEDSINWHPVGSISLLNPAGYPYRVYNIMDLYTQNLAIELGKNGRLGVQLKDAGWGLLQSGDTVTIHGSYVKEICIDDSPTPINNSVPFNKTVNNEISTILNANPNRKNVIISNESDINIYLDLGTLPFLGKGIVLKPYGIFQYSTQEINYKGVITAISSSNSVVSGIELF
ncbi:hypothetical protein IQ244_27780 [Nostoc sp. LEGE 06077]|uniref:hypothetical protein n=1 Tax=Nostoc sp. LEGE 06077 TaxID=915325 RepID=UPI0018800F74|nr:hypothetical protein [Nostoc sp. LEGE 06077]MBE9210230.1 hypothetical protein [Nostoc sp. LEGE 06077]